MDTNEQVAPGRIFLHKGANFEEKPCPCGKAIEYIRLDLHTAALAETRREIKVRTIGIIESVNRWYHDELIKVSEVVAALQKGLS